MVQFLCCMFMQGKLVTPKREVVMLMSKQTHAGGYCAGPGSVREGIGTGAR